MRFTKKQNFEERFNAVKEWMKTNTVIKDLMKQVCELYEDTNDIEQDVIKSYFEIKNTKPGGVVKKFKNEMVMNARSVNEKDFVRNIQLNWIEAVTTDQPWFDEDRICQEMGCREIYVGDGMWWDNVNKRHYCEH